MEETIVCVDVVVFSTQIYITQSRRERERNVVVI